MVGIGSDNTAIVGAVGVRVGGWMMLSCLESVYYHHQKISVATVGKKPMATTENSSFVELIIDRISAAALDGRG